MTNIGRRQFIKKYCIVASVFVFWILAALTASIPINSPKNQYKQGYEYLDPLYPDLNDGDTAWMIFATILGFMLSPLLAYFYGCIDGKSSSSQVYTCLVTSAAITMLWIFLGFSLCYGSDKYGNSVFGDPSTYYMFQNVGAAPCTQAKTVPLSIFAMYELCFPLLASTIAGCILNGRVNIVGWLFFMSCWHILIYCPIAHLIWSPNGYFSNHYIRDFSGGMVVHMTGGFTALAAIIILGPRRNPVVKVEPHAPNLLTAMTLVWLTWFCLNAGKAHAANSIAAQSIMNTMLSCCASILMWIFLDMFIHHKSTLVSISNAILVSLITMSPSSGYFTGGGAICASILSVLATYGFAKYVTYELEEPKSPLNPLTLHCFTAAVGYLLTSIFSYKFINQEGSDGLTFGSGITVAFQLASLLLLIPGIAIAGGLLFILCDQIVPVRSEEEFASMETSLDSRGSGESSSPDLSFGSDSTNTVEMFDLFHPDEHTQFLRSDAILSSDALFLNGNGNNGMNNNEFVGFGVTLADNGIRQAEKDSVVQSPDRVVETIVEESGYISESTTMRHAFRTALEDMIMTKMKPRAQESFEIAI